MKKQNNFSLYNFKQNPDGTYSKSQIRIAKRINNLRSDFINDIDIFISNQKSILTIDGIVPGLNGDKGLMRNHWSNIKRIKNIYKEIIRLHLKDGKITKHEGKVNITYIGYKSILMDWDNFCSSFKHIGDSLVKANIITDDKPSIVIKFTPQQIKCKRIEQKIVVIIENI